ncbi:molybdopterin-dependent oxidoreductase [Desulfovibrio sp. OttesenSCG-928-G15]|nr:molybdopterin-dependent oxidoreductase [Desulfovibrio sp. OttesenSCG-928-G15]
MKHTSPPDAIRWNSCNVNCGSRCALRVHVRGGVITRIETDNTGTDAYGQHQLRACLRGRSMRQRVYAKERLLYPMRRVGKRGEGAFERISWDEAINEVCARLDATLQAYGNEAVYLNYGTGAIGSAMGKSWPTETSPLARLMNVLGGYLNQYSNYSTAQIAAGMPFLFGKTFDSSTLPAMQDAQLALFFGNNPAETRMSGTKARSLQKARFTRNTRTIVIDPLYTDTMVTAGDEWIPIRPGTDAALCAALAHELITKGLVNKNFLDSYTIGYDEDSLPPGAAPGSSYVSYILGAGQDGLTKTPAWAEAITAVPAERITRLAQEITEASPCFICQGWGPQRSAYGENLSRAICMLAVLTGNIGLEGTNTGEREPNAVRTIAMAPFPTLSNPVRTAVSSFNWFQAIDDHTQMSARTAGIRGSDKLTTPIKFLWNYAGNCLTNQHGGINQMHPILADESKCESIVLLDTTFTPSARYADIVLPVCTNLEEHDWAVGGDANIAYVIFDDKCIEPLGESRSIYDICADIAEGMGTREAFTEGRTRQQWLEHLYAESRKNVPNLPATLEEAFALGVYKEAIPQMYIGLKNFRQNPVAAPLPTPSGKIEIYSQRLARIADEWTLPADQTITPLPEFISAAEGVPIDEQQPYPLQLIGHHCKQRTHSTYGNCSWLQEVAPQELWINPIDAAARGIEHAARVKVFNDRGTSYINARVTPRIMPGVVSLPQGAWHTPDANGDDLNGCVNVLTKLEPTALAKGNPHHTNLVQVEKA